MTVENILLRYPNLQTLGITTSGPKLWVYLLIWCVGSSVDGLVRGLARGVGAKGGLMANMVNNGQVFAYKVAIKLVLYLQIRDHLKID